MSPFSGFYACLEIWNVLLDFINVKLNNKMCPEERAAFLGRFQPALESLSSEVLKKLQFKFNQSQVPCCCCSSGVVAFAYLFLTEIGAK